jgi:hypothetical protein
MEEWKAVMMQNEESEAVKARSFIMRPTNDI